MAICARRSSARAAAGCCTNRRMAADARRRAGRRAASGIVTSRVSGSRASAEVLARSGPRTRRRTARSHNTKIWWISVVALRRRQHRGGAVARSPRASTRAGARGATRERHDHRRFAVAARRFETARGDHPERHARRRHVSPPSRVFRDAPRGAAVDGAGGRVAGARPRRSHVRQMTSLRR